MKRIVMVIGVILALLAIVVAVDSVRQGEDEATLWDEAFGDEAA